MNPFRAWVARVLVFCILGSGFPLPASAEIVSTEALRGAQAQREQVKEFLERAELRTRMEQLGLNVEAARARVDALSDKEVSDLAAKIDRVPAGGIDALGALILVFLVLVITDLLGYTRIFPFTRR